jgi:hypothetical protein
VLVCVDASSERLVLLLRISPRLVLLLRDLSMRLFSFIDQSGLYIFLGLRGQVLPALRQCKQSGSALVVADAVSNR